jgi:AcrR family transcriptional regulator
LVTRIRRPPTAVKKEPQQARSRATVAAVIEAGAQVLGRGGFSAFNTNRVAQVAGVSVGSIYQYFPNKLALLEAIRRRHFGEVLGVLARVTSGVRPLGGRIEELVEGLAAVHGASPALHRALLAEAPRTARGSAAQEAFEQAYLAGYMALMPVARGSRARRAEAARVLAAAVEGAVHDAALRETLKSPIFREELTRMVRSFLAT